MTSQGPSKRFSRTFSEPGLIKDKHQLLTVHTECNPMRNDLHKL